jgi:hypothetical protein
MPGSSNNIGTEKLVDSTSASTSPSRPDQSRPTRDRSGDITEVIGKIPYRMALAGGWIDQPFVSRHNPDPAGSMVVVALEPTFLYMDRSGMATSTRKIALKLWNGCLPDRPPSELVRELYAEENRGKAEPSGSQDMIGLIYPGVNRLDYAYDYEGGIFPQHIASNIDPGVARWLESVIHLLPIAQRPEGYGPLEIKNLDREWIRKLGQTGEDCFAAIEAQDIQGLGASMNACMRCWEAILPYTVRHPSITTDLMGILEYYQAHYDGAMYSGCGGGYLFVVSKEAVPGEIRVRVRLAGGDSET